MKGMSLKDEGEITKLAKEKKKIWSELKAFCSSQVLEEAKASIFHELTDQGKEALSDVSPENEVSRVSILLFRFKYVVWEQEIYGSSNLYVFPWIFATILISDS
jgi:hypothetical protein